MHQDRLRLEHADRRRAALIQQRRDLGVRVDGDEAAAELIAFADPNQPSVVFGAAMALRQQFLQHHRDLHAIGRRQRIELERMASDRQLLVMGRPGDRPVDAGEPAAVFFVPGPNLGRRVGGRVGHSCNSWS
jgi:hypothetical protein